MQSIAAPISTTFAFVGVVRLTIACAPAAGVTGRFAATG
jgi:hypothetical protein